jgi:hypothetical protein
LLVAGALEALADRVDDGVDRLDDVGAVVRLGGKVSRHVVDEGGRNVVDKSSDEVDVRAMLGPML